MGGTPTIGHEPHQMQLGALRGFRRTMSFTGGTRALAETFDACPMPLR